MPRKLLFKALSLVTLLSVILAFPVLAAPGLGDALRPASQTTPEPSALDAQPAFEADLSGANEVPPVATPASGRAVLVLFDDAGTLTLHYRVTVSDISDITAAHIHAGAPGENGPVVFTLFDGTGTFDPDNPISGSIAITNAELTELLTGNYYINVHTSEYPDGEIRGQVGQFAPPADYQAALTGAKEVPPVETEATGLALFSLNSALDSLEYAVYVRDIADITEAHIFTGPPDENGTLLFTLYDGTGTFDPDNPISGTLALTPEELLELLTGNLYVNVLTSANPAGEIRGQITSGPLAFDTLLSGANEVPRVLTSASGRSVMLLEPDGTLHYYVEVSAIADITAAHIHVGQPGENGDIVVTLYDGTGTFDPDNPLSGALTLTPEQSADLLAGSYYANVHTTGNPDGEIRGQLLPMESVDLNAVLLGRNEVPPVSTGASGVAHFTPGADMLSLQYEIAVLDIVGITAAHLHPGLPGEENPPLITLFDSADPRPFDPDNPISGEVDIEVEGLFQLLAGGLYLNVHTAGNPDGEIRGQVGSGLHPFEADLSGAEEVPPVETNASGRAVVVLDDDMSTLVYRVSVEQIVDITAAHIHEAPPGENGGVIFTLFDGTGNFGPGQPISGTLSLDLTQAAKLFAGDYYVNVHTDENPDGEIRGQLGLATLPHDFIADLQGENEVPPVDTAASGAARLDLRQSLEVLHYRLEVEQISGITAAHIHTAPVGENGPVRFPLFDGTGDFGPGEPISGDVALEAQDLLDLLTEFLYVNVHTAENPDGEIRGQIIAEFVVYLPLVLHASAP
jgi:hypothetical protein